MFLRNDTIEKQKEDRAVDYDRQQIVFALAIRGEGKSRMLEGEISAEFFEGYTILDLHAPPNIENGFWCIPNLDPENKMTMDELKEEYQRFKKNPLPYIKNGNPISVTFLCSEATIWGQDAQDKFNDRIYTEKEYYRDNPHGNFNLIYPQKKPKEKWGKELVRFVKLPTVTAKEDSIVNLKAVEIITNAILDARKERRIVVLNRALFFNERQYFWTMELIHRSLPDICDKYFLVPTPEMFGKTLWKQLKPYQRKNNRLTVFHRELADLAPAKLKADKTGESTPVKKSLLGFARICRHWEIDWFADWQHNNSVEGGIRDQADTWLIKKYNRDLGGEEKKGFFDLIDSIRKIIIDKGRNSAIARRIADSFYPKCEELAKKYFYAKFLNSHIKIFEVKPITHQHKEPWMKFTEITGIWIDFDKTLAKDDTGAVSSVGASKSDEMAIFNIIWTFRNPRNGKVKPWSDIQTELIKYQKEGTVNYPQKFDSIKPLSIQKKYKRWCEKFGEPLETKVK